MSKHTKGPWEYLSSGNGSCGAITSKTGWVCDFVDNPSPEDARLIAAAPELLEALGLLIATLDACDETFYIDGFGFVSIDDLKEVCRKTIAKAKGEQ